MSSRDFNKKNTLSSFFVTFVHNALDPIKYNVTNFYSFPVFDMSSRNRKKLSKSRSSEPKIYCNHWYL